MERNLSKKATYEDRFARRFYCNAHRFISRRKKKNNKDFRRKLKLEGKDEKD